MNKNTKERAIKIGVLLLPYVCAFLISFCIGLLLFKAKNIMPFGDQSVLCMDLWGQYFPMYVQKANADSVSELLYSWNGALGYNNWAQNAYYCNSVFLLLLEFVPLGKMVDAINWICLLKICFSSVTCLGFLQFKLKSRSPYLIAGAVAYGTCAYMLAFLSQPMWTDSLIYVPLILIGLERLVHEKKPLLYVAFLALTIISSFYIGFAVCIFLVLYFFCTAVQHFRIEKDEEGKRHLIGGRQFGWSFLRFALFSIFSGGLSAAVILPIASAVGNTVASTLEAPTKLEWYDNILIYIQQLLPSQKLALEYDRANIAVGILVFLLVPLYFCNKKFRITERVAHGLLLVLLFLSMNCNLLDYVWHGFHFPNQLPGRWTFLLSLVLVLLCSSGIARREGLTPIRTIIGIVLGFAALIVTTNGLGKVEAVELGTLHWILLIAAALLLLANSVIVLQTERNQKSEQDTEDTPAAKTKTAAKPAVSQLIACGCVVLLAGMQVYDSGANFVNVAQREEHGMRTSAGPGYNETVVKTNTWGEEWKSDSQDFYRIEANSGFTFNPSMLGNYNGMGYYSSTMNGKTFELLRYFGNRVYAQNVSSVYNISSPVQNGLFGVRYILDFSRNLGHHLPGSSLIAEDEKCNIWESPTTLPIAFAVSDNAMNIQITDEVRAIQNQNTFLNILCGEDVNVFERMDCSSFYYENASLQESSNWNQNYFTITDSQYDARFHYEYTCTEDGPIYLEHNYRAGTIEASWEGKMVEISPGAQKFRYLGEFAAGDVITIDVTIGNISIGCCGLNLYRMNTDTWNSTYQKLAAQSLDVESFSNTALSGTIQMAQDGLVMTTIPQDGGWSVYCDGRKAETVLIADTLVAVRVPEGSHTLKFTYQVPGLQAGVLITVICLILAVWCGSPKLRKWVFSKVKKPSEPDPSENEAPAFEA